MLVTEKLEIRKTFKEIRSLVPENRRLVSSIKALETIEILVESAGLVLSYVSFSDEFCTKAINHLLAQKQKLVLPKVEGDHLALYQVTNPDTQLVISSLKIPEPDPSKCEKLKSHISIALIPGLAFDRNFNRIGYGKGYYDKLIKTLPSSSRSFGLGFYEQLISEPLPIEPHDSPLDDILLF